MSYATVDDEWLPCEKTLNAIKRRHLSKKQYVKVLKQFRAEKRNTIVENANTVFLNMFKGMYGEDTPAPDRTADKKQAEARKANFEAKAENSAERAEEVKEQKGVMSQDDARRWINEQRGLPQDHGITK